ncbi:MAG: hypothetical protein OXI59_23540 [Gemmatimonadota bacterium]|nr:hypothetical protein [Gemmatimonadota bacterium]
MILIFAALVFIGFLLIQTSKADSRFPQRRIGIVVVALSILGWLSFQGFERGLVEVLNVVACVAILSVIIVACRHRLANRC